MKIDLKITFFVSAFFYGIVKKENEPGKETKTVVDESEADTSLKKLIFHSLFLLSFTFSNPCGPCTVNLLHVCSSVRTIFVILPKVLE